MESAAILGVLCNSIQLLEVAWKLLSGARAIYRSQHGTSLSTKVLDAIANDVADLSVSISKQGNCSPELAELSRSSEAVASNLSDLLARLKTKQPHSKWQSFRVALREVWTKEEAREFADQIHQLQAQSTTHIQYLILDKQSAVYKEIQSLQQTTLDLGMRSQKDIDQVRKLVGDLISKTQTKETEARVQEALKDLRQLTLQPSTELDVISAKLDAVADSISRLQSDIDTTRSNQDTLRALCFEGFDSRQHNILDAHTTTFEWAFSDEAQGVHGMVPLYFKDWLQNHNGTYWIRGKAGSGKSTLMKFLYNDKRTASALQTWAGDDRKLVMAKYFIYNLGQPLQKSQEGLMRTLLVDILCHCPEHIPKVRDILNRGHGHIWNGKETWTLKTLWQLLKAIIAETAATKICLFLDGMDEIDGEVESLIDTVKALAGLSVKVCVSSRPWAEFIHEFGTDSKRVLKVEDLTAGDIRSYVHQTLTGNSRFRTLAAKDSMLSRLQDEIVSKSAGVFLWVRLVVRSLLQAPTYADTPSLLWRRFRSIPPDLDKYFLQIIQSIPYIYRAKGAGIFKMAMSCPSMPAMVHYFIDCYEEDKNFALDCPLQAMQPDETTQNIQEMVIKLDGWTKGLLEVVNYAPGPNYECTRVEFLHRTVRDFLEESGHARQLLDNLQRPQQEVSEMICHGSLAFLKRHPKIERAFRPYILCCIFSHAAFAANDEWKRIHHILNLCGNAMVEDGRDWRGTAMTRTILGYAAQYGLKEYIQETLQNWDYTESSVGWRGVDAETLYTELLNFTIPCQVLPPSFSVPVSPQPPWGSCKANWASLYRTVAFLIDEGADPNATWKSSTAWMGFCRNCETRLRSRDSITIDICRALVAGGADLDIPWGTSTFRNEIRHILPKDQAEDLLALAPCSSGGKP